VLGNLQGDVGLGLVGTGAGGGGTGYGRGAGGLGGVGGRRAGAPSVVLGRATVRGSIDQEIIRRIIRRHINEVKYCYERELLSRPDLAGRVTVQFTIAASGQVVTSVLQNSTVGNARLESCVVQAVRRWEFPKPAGGGIVIVAYPFVLMPHERATGESEQRTPPVRDTHQALAILAGPGDLAERVARVSEFLELARMGDPESLAWTIDRRGAGLQEVTLVARLLVAAGRNHDAIRVLSERAAEAPESVAGELRRIGAEKDAAEVLELSGPKSRRRRR